MAAHPTPMLRNLLYAASAFLVFACSPANSGNAGGRHPAADSLICSVLLDSLRPRRRPAYVERQFLTLRDTGAALPGLAGWVHKQDRGVDSALVVRLVRERYPGTVEQLVGHPAGVRWFEPGRTARDSGEGGDQWRWLSLSRVAYTPDTTHALVYASMWCGGLCGNGSFYLLQRDLAGHWRVIARVVQVIS